MDIKEFWDNVHKTETCWIWMRAKDSDGYGHLKFNGVDKVVRAHRVSYESVKGEIPKNLEIDHLCRNRICVNPDHLEAVTKRENNLRGESPAAKNARKIICKNGHFFSRRNTYVRLNKNNKVERKCRECNRLSVRKYEKRIKEAA